MPPKRSSTSQTDPSVSERGSTSGLVFSRAGIRSSHAAASRQSINMISTSTSNPFYTTADYATTISRPRTGRRNTGRPSTARPRTGVSTLGAENQEIICAISESRGVSPVLGLSFVNLDTGEAVLSQINDSQTYVRTIHKLTVFNPTTILIVSSASDPKSKLFSIIEDSLEDLDSEIRLLDRRYWAETVGLDYIQQLAFAEDVEALKTAVSGNYYAVCCFAAVCTVSVPSKSQTQRSQVTGSQICRACTFKDVPHTLTPHQVRTIRRLHDDGSVDRPIT
jgi:DNA mismatch repair protein MSH4